MTTPTHWCPVPNLEHYDAEDKLGLFVSTSAEYPKEVYIGFGVDPNDCESIGFDRPAVLKLRDHLTELLKHMPENDQ